MAYYYPAMRRRRFLLMGALFASVSYNMGVVTFTTGNVIREFSVDKTLAGFLVSITLIGWFFGSAIFGHISDRVGRRKIVLSASLLHILSTFLMSFSTSYLTFLLLRFLAGMGFGMVLPVLTAWVSEESRSEVRGRNVVLLDSFWTYGWIAASLAAYLYFPSVPTNAWRYYYTLSALWFLVLIPAFRLENKRNTSSRAKISTVMRIKYSYPLWIIWFGMAFSYYGMFVWLPSIFSEIFPLLTSYEFIFLTYIAQIPGYLTAAYLVERVGRRIVIFSYVILTAFSAFIFIMSPSSYYVFSAICLSFFDLGAWGALYAITPEIYPPDVKGTGSGMASSIGRIGGIIGPVIPGFLNWMQSFLVYIAMLLFSAFSVIFLRETRGD